jgi:hypothetical protein
VAGTASMPWKGMGLMENTSKCYCQEEWLKELRDLSLDQIADLC